MELLDFIHTKRYTFKLIQMPSLYILGHTLYLKSRLKWSPDIAQAAMENVLSDIKDAAIYMDDVGAFSSDWDQHFNLLATILQRLHEQGFTINPLKSEWAIKETDWLGYWLTP
jgi:hypothetical protein